MSKPKKIGLIAFIGLTVIMVSFLLDAHVAPCGWLPVMLAWLVFGSSVIFEKE